MKSLQCNDNDPVFIALFSKIPLEIANTFNDEQLEAIKKAFCSQDKNRPSLEMRVSVPLIRLQFELVLLTDLKRNSKQYLHSAKGVYSFWTRSNIICLIGFLIVLSTSSFLTLPFLFSSLTSIFTSSPYPTSIPWLENQFDCNHAGRSWRNSKCWDSEHNPMF